MKNGIKLCDKSRSGSVLILVMVSLVILMASGMAMMAVSYGVRRESIQAKNEAVAMLAAEAGYERAIFRMSQQPDLLTALADEDFVASETLSIDKPDEEGYEGDDSEQTGMVDYTINFDSFMGSRPVYKVSATGHCGVFDRTVDVYVIQAISGWDMGMCRIPTGTYSTSPVNYITGEIIDMPLHINCYGDDPYDNEKDIWISGSPDFRQPITMSESQYNSEGGDKYSDVMYLFDEGIYFMQPSSRIMDRDVVESKAEHFRDTIQSQKPEQILTPVKNDSVPDGMAAVQLEFFVDGDVGKVRITNDCTVRGHMKSPSYDYRIDASYDEGLRFEKYYIYGFHYVPEDAEAMGQRYTEEVTDTYVTPTYGDVEGEPGGQIYVNGNVVIGGDISLHGGNQRVKGRVTVVATGNIWVADSILLDGPHGADGLPSTDNPNVLGLVAQGVVKVVDPGALENYVVEGDRTWVSTRRGGYWEYEYEMPEVSGAEYEPIGVQYGSEDYERILPRYTEVEAAITVGGGGWGAENVYAKDYPYSDDGTGRNDAPGGQNYIVVRGTITESVRGVVGRGSDGYAKRYYLDGRLLEGILPGDIWLKGKYIPAPAGWHDYRSRL